VAHDRVAADDGLAVHVAGERHESGFREPPRAAARVVVEPGANVNDPKYGPRVGSTATNPLSLASSSRYASCRVLSGILPLCEEFLDSRMNPRY
jgi:hypothetical protein